MDAKRKVLKGDWEYYLVLVYSGVWGRAYVKGEESRIAKGVAESYLEFTRCVIDLSMAGVSLRKKKGDIVTVGWENVDEEHVKILAGELAEKYAACARKLKQAHFGKCGMIFDVTAQKAWRKVIGGLKMLAA